MRARKISDEINEAKPSPWSTAAGCCGQKLVLQCWSKAGAAMLVKSWCCYMLVKSWCCYMLVKSWCWSKAGAGKKRVPVLVKSCCRWDSYIMSYPSNEGTRMIERSGLDMGVDSCRYRQIRNDRLV